MKKAAIAGIVIVLVGIVGYAVNGARNQEPSAATATSRPAVTTSRAADAGPTSTQKAPSDEAGGVIAAIRRAGEAKAHLYVFVYDKDDDRTRGIRKKFDAAVAPIAEKARTTTVNRDLSSETEFVDKYSLKTAPMPLVLVFAPNGAIVGGFIGERLDEQQLRDALASPAKQACVKALQDRKLVFLSIQNSTTKSNDTATRGVAEFKADARFSQATEVIKIDPADAAEKAFLTQLQVDPKADQATTVFLAPPGAMVAKLSGATDKNKLITALQSASTGCGAGGCGPKGCAVKK